MRAWREGIAASPPLWFALHQDLKILDPFLPITDTPKRVDLDQWCLKLEQTPWLLTQKNRVPKSITQHIRVLEAYRKGWHTCLQGAPWTVWVSRGSSRWPGQQKRVYMSHALLADSLTIDTLTRAWQHHVANNSASWAKASARIQAIPAVQFAVLRAILTMYSPAEHPIETHFLDRDLLNICRGIHKSILSRQSARVGNATIYKRLDDVLAKLGFDSGK